MAWKKALFTEVVKDVSAGNLKTLQKDYLLSGEIPIIDQGQDLIGGFTNDEKVICKARYPVIVFGDHTRAVKFIDFPFAMGADGTKVLQPKNNDNIKYLYYAIKAIDLSSAGYSRHFKFLKEKYIPLPPLAEQQRIADILDTAEALHQQRRDAIALLDEFLQATFLEMFGDPVTNPKGWAVSTVEELLQNKIILGVQDGNHGEQHPKVKDFSEKGVPFIMANCIEKGHLVLNKAHKLSEDWLHKLRIGFAKKGDVLLSHKGTIGEVAIVPENVEIVILSPQVTYYRLSKEIQPSFLANLFSSIQFKRILEKEAKQSTRAYIGITRQKKMSIPLPPLTLQTQFADIVETVEAQKAQQQAHLAELDTLFACLQQRAFSGGL